MALASRRATKPGLMRPQPWRMPASLGGRKMEELGLKKWEIPRYPLVIEEFAIENGPLSSLIYLLKMVIFHGYVSLPEGNWG